MATVRRRHEASNWRYIQLASHVRQLVERAVLRPGARLPSVRRLSRQHKVSVATAQAAYRLLERDRLIESRPRSGFFVAVPARQLAPPRISCSAARPRLVTVGERGLTVIRSASDPRLVPLGAAVPSLELLPVATLARLMGRAARQYPSQCASYDVLPGCRRFREQIAKRAVEAGCVLRDDDLVVTNGTMEALHLALRAVASPGDIIAVESPTFFGMLQLLESLGMRALEIATDPRTGVVIEDLERALDRHRIKAALFSLSFQNPTGACMPDDAKKRLVSLLASHRVALIEDDIYGELPFTGARPRAAKAFDMGGDVLWCGSLSKTLAPGLRAGWIAPGKYIAEVERLKSLHTITNAPGPLLAAAEFLESGRFERHLDRLRATFAQNVRRIAAAVAEFFPEGTRAAEPVGGMVLWVELPAGADAMELHSQALEHRIGLAPGPLFSASGSYRHFIRLSCGMVWSECVERALRQLGRLVYRQLNH